MKKKNPVARALLARSGHAGQEAAASTRPKIIPSRRHYSRRPRTQEKMENA